MLGKQAKPNEVNVSFKLESYLLWPLGNVTFINSLISISFKVETEMKHHEFIIERKFDGERMQLHMKDGEYRYFSRK